jgi:hypothetical protein
MSKRIIGRDKERKTLQKCLESKQSEFVVIYGRRRVGKTFLVKELLGDEFAFYATGILNGTREDQLCKWNEEIVRYGGATLPAAQDWYAAFENLNTLLTSKKTDEKKIVFLDEAPWLATMHAGFLSALDHYWNRWASSQKDVLLIVCGSATSWIVENIIGDRGGLHNRLTRRIWLEPFTLRECEAYFVSRGVPMTRYQMAEAYMIFGGIPYYLSLMDPSYSLYQNVDAMYFAPDAELGEEFENLYRSLFRRAENHLRVVEALTSKGKGLTREEIVDLTQWKDGGGLTKVLKDLTVSGFVRVYRPFGKKKRGSLYQLTDAFSLFHLRFRDRRSGYSPHFWLSFSATQGHAAWSGYAFEMVCLLHLEQIKKRLGILGVLTEVSSWRSTEQKDGEGAQIDLVIERGDKVINLCEAKYVSEPFDIDAKYAEALRNKRAAFLRETRTRHAVQTTMITTFGVKRNAYGMEIISEVTLDDLFDA